MLGGPRHAISSVIAEFRAKGLVQQVRGGIEAARWDPLRDLIAEGFVGGSARAHVGFMGYTMQLKRMYEETAPQIAEEIDKKSRADVVVLTGG